VCATTVGAENDTRNDRIRANEEVLISRILEGEKDLFLELIRPYQRTVYATLISMLGSKEVAEDVTQEVLLKALARIHQFRRESAFGTWLIQIAINEARMRKRKPSSAGFSISPQDPAGAGLPFIGVTGLFNLGFSRTALSRGSTKPINSLIITPK
jgi:hypothetical protein